MRARLNALLVPILVLAFISTLRQTSATNDKSEHSNNHDRVSGGPLASDPSAPVKPHDTIRDNKQQATKEANESALSIEEAREQHQEASDKQQGATTTTETTTTTTTTITTQIETTESEQLVTTTEKSAEQTKRDKELAECIKDSYCLNGGTCVVLDDGKWTCECPPGFYGNRCQTRNICKTEIVGSLTGEQICERLGRTCLLNDKFFQCECHEDEYFVFKTPEQLAQQKQKAKANSARGGAARHDSTDKEPSTFAYDSLLPLENWTPQNAAGYASNQKASNGTGQALNFLAECRKVDKCLGLRCRQLSERCLKGECVCNQDLGYTRDPNDGLCKLLDPCRMPTADGLPICGEQAKCVATYNRELYHCVCPIGYTAVKVNSRSSSTRCAPITDMICSVPLLNKCQQVCKIDHLKNSYKCSCLPGYKPGTRAGFDDHMCFFDEHTDQQEGVSEQLDWQQQQQASSLESDLLDPYFGRARNQRATKSYDDASKRQTTRPSFVYRPYVVAENPPPPPPPPPQPGERSLTGGGELQSGWRFQGNGSTFGYTPEESGQHYKPLSPLESALGGDEKSRSKRFPESIIKREPRAPVNGADEGQWHHEQKRAAVSPHSAGYFGQSASLGAGASSSAAIEMDQLSAMDRCNMYCEENKICVLESGSNDSYRCVCDRQGFVSVGDRCLDWCTAAEFSYTVQYTLEKVCFSGVCKALRRERHWRQKVDAEQYDSQLEELSALELQSSWRPAFECDCSSSPVLRQDPVTKLCELDFDEIIRPCLRGNEGYQDCVVNKHSYCVVLHKNAYLFQRDLLAEQLLGEPPTVSSGKSSGDPKAMPRDKGGAAASSSASATAAKKIQSLLEGKSNKLYECVCSPEKKFLVDKPRNKARCINECDLLNVECGRFNRMCRAATIANDLFGHESLVYEESSGGYRFSHIKRTGCECLPGFNVGPSELLDFTLDDNYPPGSSKPGDQPLVDPFAPLAHLQQDAPPSTIQGLIPGELGGDELAHLRTRYMNINSRCLLDYDVIEFEATFKAPANFEPAWIQVKSAPTVTANDKPSVAATAPEGPNFYEPPLLFGNNERSTSDTYSSDPEAPCESSEECTLKMPAFMLSDIGELHKNVVLVAHCNPSLAPLSLDMYRACVRYKYWLVQKLRHHFADWRRVLTESLRGTFDLMEGDIRLRVNKCQANIKRIETVPEAYGTSIESHAYAQLPPLLSSISSVESEIAAVQQLGDLLADVFDNGETSNSPPPRKAAKLKTIIPTSQFNPYDQFALIDADLACELTIHSARDTLNWKQAHKVLLEKQLPKFIFDKPAERLQASALAKNQYYLMAPGALIHRETFDQLAKHRKLFSPCESQYAYCDKQTRCEMVDSVNFSCTCEYGYTPIGSRDIYFGDSRKEVCEDIDECLFDVCKENGLENKSICVNEIGDYRCQCTRHHVGDNKRYCNHICNVISCKYGDCRLPDEHHAFCECHEGYLEADCSLQDPSVALRKANMIICGSIFTSVLLLAITLAISLNSQLKKTKKELKRLEAVHEAAQMFEMPSQQAPFGRARLSRVSSGS